MSAYFGAKIILGGYIREREADLAEYKKLARRAQARVLGLPDGATQEEIDAAEFARAKRASEMP